jgi:hypothetical protein
MGISKFAVCKPSPKQRGSPYGADLLITRSDRLHPDLAASECYQIPFFETQSHRGTEGRGKGRVGKGRIGFRLELAGSVNSVPPCFQSPRMHPWFAALF